MDQQERPAVEKYKLEKHRKQFTRKRVNSQTKRHFVFQMSLFLYWQVLYNYGMELWKHV